MHGVIPRVARLDATSSQETRINRLFKSKQLAQETQLTCFAAIMRHFIKMEKDNYLHGVLIIMVNWVLDTEKILALLH